MLQAYPALQGFAQWLVGFGRRRAFWPCMLLAGYALLAWYRFQLTTGAFRNSDDSGNFLAGVEMAEGNWHLAGWVMAPDNYYPTDVLGQAVLRCLFGYHPIFMMLWEGLIWGGVAWLGTVLACKGKPVCSWPGTVCLGLAMLSFNVFDHTFADSFLSTIASHGCTILLTLAAIGLASTWPRAGAVGRVALGGFVMIGCFSDPIFNVIACLPILIIGLLGVKRGTTLGSAIGCMTVTLVGMVVARLLVAYIAWLGGFESVHLTIALASFPELLAHVSFAAESMIRLLGGNFFGRVLGQSPKDGPYIQLLRSPLVLAFIIAIASAIRSIGRRVHTWPASTIAGEADDLNQMLAVSVMLCVASACTTTVIEDQSCARFFLPAVVTGSVLTARLLGGIRLVGLYAGILLPASAAFGMIALPRHETPRSTIVIPQVRQLADVLRQRDLTHGYAGYWESTIVTALTKRQITSLPLSPGGDGRLHTFRWLANLSWYARAAKDWRGPIFFIAANQPGSLELSEADGRRQFGALRDRINLGQFVIDVFDSSDAGYRPPVD